MTGDLPDQCRAAARAAFVLDTNYPKWWQLKVHLTFKFRNNKKISYSHPLLFSIIAWTICFTEIIEHGDEYSLAEYIRVNFI